MSLGNGLFLLFFIMILLILCIPLQIQFTLNHQHQWSGAVMLKIFQWHFTLYRSGNDNYEHLEHKLEQMIEEQQKNSRFIKINWKSLFSFGREALHILAKHLRLQQLFIRCHIGWERADYTAYSYGLFWAAVSALPTSWLEQSDILYEPDFQTKKKEVAVQGIIRCTIAQLISILTALLVLTVREMRMQNRKGQMAV